MSSLIALDDAGSFAEPPAAPAQTAHDLRRQHVLGAARLCFARSGFHGASMQQICAEAQMSPGALYRYFPSKDAIIEAIAQEERAQAGECMAALMGEGSIIDRLTAVGMTYLRDTRDPNTGGLMVEICAESIRNTAIGKRFHEIESEVRADIHETLRRAQLAGEIDADIDVAMALSILMGIGDGLVMRLQLEKSFDVEAIEPYLRRLVTGLFGTGSAS